MKSRFIVLACSYKHGGRCVAGIDLKLKKIIRLISSDKESNYAIPKQECYIDGRSLMPLDVIDIELGEKAPTNGAQTENYFASFPLVKAYIGRANEEFIKPYRFKSDKSPYPFDTKDPYLSHGAYYHKDYSLCLIQAYALYIKTIKNSEGTDKTKITFDVYKYNKEKVTLTDYSVTDPNYMIFDGINKTGKESIGKAWLLISLGQDDDSDNYYKFVSGIIDVSKPLTDFFDK